MYQHHADDARQTTLGARPLTAGTSDRAAAFLRRQALWGRLLSLFRHHRPTEDQLVQVSALAEVAIDQVFAAYKLSEAQMVARHGDVKDFAECAALYGYVLGLHQGREETERAMRRYLGEVNRADSAAD